MSTTKKKFTSDVAWGAATTDGQPYAGTVEVSGDDVADCLEDAAKAAAKAAVKAATAEGRVLTRLSVSIVDY